MTPSRTEIRPLTGLRAIAALWVVLFHLKGMIGSLFPGVSAIVAPVLDAGYLGVDLFFILSGFIISYTYADILQPFSVRVYGVFLWARLARIYPVHLAMLFAALALFLFDVAIGHDPQVSEWYTGTGFAESALLVHGWHGAIYWNAPSWSVSSEWAAYLIFPFLLPMFDRVSRPRTAFVYVVAGTALMFLTVRLIGHMGTVPYGMLRIAFEFPLGCILFQLYRRGIGASLPWAAIITAALAAILVVALTPLRLFIWTPGLLALIIYGLAWSRGWPATLLAGPVAVYWGRVSYSLYMVHGLALIALYNVVPPDGLAGIGTVAGLVLVTTVVAVILALAVLTYHFVEEPCRRMMRRMPARRTGKMAVRPL